MNEFFVRLFCITGVSYCKSGSPSCRNILDGFSLNHEAHSFLIRFFNKIGKAISANGHHYNNPALKTVSRDKFKR
jgi:hypothetical protein